MAEPVNPVLGGLRGIRRSFSSNFFTTGGVRQQQADSNTNVVANRNSVLLSNISKQLDNIGKQNVLLNKSLEVISTNLTASSLLDRQRDAANAAREKQLAEQGFRSSKEGAIESKIQEALLTPVKKIAAVTKFTLGKLTTVFGILVGGWLIDNVFDLLKVNAEGNIEKIEEIKSNILKGLAIAGGVFLLFNVALFAIGATLSKLSLTVATLALKGIFKKPILSLGKLLIAAASGVLGLNYGRPTGGSSSLPVTPGTSKGDTKVGNVKPSRFSRPSNLTMAMTGIDQSLDIAEGRDKWWEAGIDFFTGISLASLARPLTSNIKHPVARGLAEALLYFGLLNTGTEIRPTIKDKLSGKEDNNELPDRLEGESDDDYLKRLGVMPGQFTPITEEDLERERELTNENITGLNENNIGSFLDKVKTVSEKEDESSVIDADIIQKNITPIKKDKSVIEEAPPDETPEILTLPPVTTSDMGKTMSTVAAGAPGGGVPALLARNDDNSYVYLAFKHYQVTPR